MEKQLEWAFVPNQKNITTVNAETQHTYDLVNLACGEALGYGTRRVGINLVWVDPIQSDNIRIVRQSTSKEPLKFGELIAIHVRKGKYLTYQVRNTSVNLGWSNKPAFQWKITGGRDGNPVKTMSPIGLFNTVERDWLIYGRRPTGINCCWLKDQGKYATISVITDILVFLEDCPLVAR
ncbi:MAG: hypothetical protein ACOYXT_11625 [Bacteroidota bacterium]